MRVWSVHPRYLDRAGLTALWREGLLAQKVLTGTTRGYRNHPQLVRFLPGGVPLGPYAADAVPAHPGAAITTYLHGVADEAEARGYRYDRTLVLGAPDATLSLPVTRGQLSYEWGHLTAKLAVRAPDVLRRWADVDLPDPHPLLHVVPGPVEDWEVLVG